MGILSSNFLANAKSKLKYLPSALYSTASHVKSQAHVSRGFAVDPNNKNNDDKLRFLFMYFVKDTRYASVISAETSWKIDELRSNNFIMFTPQIVKFVRALDCRYDIVASIDELMLVSSWDAGCLRKHDILWNPTSQEINIIPVSPYCKRHFTDMLFGLGFDPAKPRGYKILKILIDYCDFKAPPEFRAELYSLETRSWRKIKYPYQQEGIPTSRGIRIGGSYYWGLSARTNSIISFNFAREKFSRRLLPFPWKIRYIESNYLLGELDGSLAILLLTDDCGNAQVPYSTLEIWVWNDKSWYLKSKLEIPVAVDRVIGLFENNKLFLRDITGKVLLFDVAEPRSIDITGICADSKVVSIMPYVESSVPLNASTFESVRGEQLFSAADEQL
ncbi:F-box protein [Striga asiatica]|uniref:F-box protein n=1 Tax=Striga asiatica TaxID=4170 RepID=A0A5A7NYM9_STRAF|nr:F-box protein [Striga asiatica]